MLKLVVRWKAFYYKIITVMHRLNTTLLFLIKDDQILLALKKRGFGSGKYNGIGGKIEAKETIEQAMLRETKEEINVIPEKYVEAAKIVFNEYFNNQPTIIEMHVFVTEKWTNDPIESEEMRPKWFKLSNIPYDKMWPDDRLWLPLVLDGNKIIAKFKLNENDKIEDYKIKLEGALELNGFSKFVSLD